MLSSCNEDTSQFLYTRTQSTLFACLYVMINFPHVRESEFQSPGNFSRGIRNPGLWNPKYTVRNGESH